MCPQKPLAEGGGARPGGAGAALPCEGRARGAAHRRHACPCPMHQHVQPRHLCLAPSQGPLRGVQARLSPRAPPAVCCVFGTPSSQSTQDAGCPAAGRSGHVPTSAGFVGLEFELPGQASAREGRQEPWPVAVPPPVLPIPADAILSSRFCPSRSSTRD
ncbi:AP-3 complex subunit sigma-2 [Aix galericulata]|nr:AP-3 complex subunit sigma-2 [Aix galericulata]